MKVAIVGSRKFPHLEQVQAYVQGLPADTEVVSGGASGVDQIAVGAAAHAGLRFHVFYADWEKHGKAAGIIRNADIVARADRVVAFWDGKSRGTADTIRRAQNAGKPVEVFRAHD